MHLYWDVSGAICLPVLSRIATFIPKVLENSFNVVTQLGRLIISAIFVAILRLYVLGDAQSDKLVIILHNNHMLNGIIVCKSVKDYCLLLTLILLYKFHIIDLLKEFSLCKMQGISIIDIIL